MTSSPGPMFSAIRHANNASLPDDIPIACAQLQYRAMASSHSSTLGPNMKSWDCMTSAIADSTSVLIGEYCALRSNRGTCMSIISFADDYFCSSGDVLAVEHFRPNLYSGVHQVRPHDNGSHFPNISLYRWNPVIRVFVRVDSSIRLDAPDFRRPTHRLVRLWLQQHRNPRMHSCQSSLRKQSWHSRRSCSRAPTSSFRTTNAY